MFTRGYIRLLNYDWLVVWNVACCDFPYIGKYGLLIYGSMIMKYGNFILVGGLEHVYLYSIYGWLIGMVNS